MISIKILYKIVKIILLITHVILLQLDIHMVKTLIFWCLRANVKAKSLW